jgi:phage-related minor tail protein
MDDDVDTAVIAVRADRRAFAAEVDAMRATLESGLGAGADRAGRAIEASLLRAARTGRFGFEDLRRVALSALAEIARGALSAGFGAIGGGGKGSGLGGLLGIATSLVGGLFGLPGRATGGPVAPGAAYLVGERGPELFVPTASGRIEPGGRAASARDIRITVNVNGAGNDPQRMAASGRQIAQAVRRAMIEAEE